MKKLPQIIQHNNGYSFTVDDQPFMMLAAEVHNSACTSRQYMEHVWDKAKQINCNTV